MNKKILLSTIVIIVLVAALGVVGIAAAQTPTPPNGFGYGNGMMGGYGGGNGGGMMGGYGGAGRYDQGMMNGDDGPLHDAMFDALAEGLGLSRADLDARVAAGETPYQIAISLGFSQTEFAQIMIDARTAALADAVAAGTLTQAQADRMQTRMNRFGGNCPHLVQDSDDAP